MKAKCYFVGPGYGAKTYAKGEEVPEVVVKQLRPDFVKKHLEGEKPKAEPKTEPKA